MEVLSKANGIDNFITHCYADMEVVNFLLDTITDYHDIVNVRHHDHINVYNQYKRNFKMTCIIREYSEEDMKRIFWRIQRKLLLEFIERAGRNKIKVNSLPKNFDAFLLWQLEQFRDDAILVYGYIKKKITKQYDIDGVSEKRKKLIIEVLDALIMRDDLENILPEKIYLIAKDLLNGIPYTEVAKKHDKTVAYLATNIIGKENWRNKSERGWLGYIKDQENTKNDKIIQFPLQ